MKKIFLLITALMAMVATQANAQSEITYSLADGTFTSYGTGYEEYLVKWESNAEPKLKLAGDYVWLHNDYYYFLGTSFKISAPTGYKVKTISAGSVASYYYASTLTINGVSTELPLTDGKSSVKIADVTDILKSTVEIKVSTKDAAVWFSPKDFKITIVEDNSPEPAEGDYIITNGDTGSFSGTKWNSNNPGALTASFSYVNNGNISSYGPYVNNGTIIALTARDGYVIKSISYSNLYAYANSAIDFGTEKKEFATAGYVSGSVEGLNSNKVTLNITGTMYLGKKFTVTLAADTSTGISAVSAAAATENVVFDLQGRRVQAPQKGIYIVNGKKVVVK